VHEGIEHGRRLQQFGALTTRGHEQSDLTSFSVDDEQGGVAYLLGARIPDATGGPIDELAPGVRLVTATRAYPTELAYAVSVADAANVMALFTALGPRAHVSSRVRAAVC